MCNYPFFMYTSAPEVKDFIRSGSYFGVQK